MLARNPSLWRHADEGDAARSAGRAAAPRRGAGAGAGPGQVLVEVAACGVCRTDLHVVDGELAEAKLPIVPGHEVVGRVVEAGAGVDRFERASASASPGSARPAATAATARSARENLCDFARFTGYQIDGGYAEYTVADARYCFPIPGGYGDTEAAPLLCAGLIGYRTLRMAGEGARLGIYGFGAAAHIVAQLAASAGPAGVRLHPAGDVEAQDFARALGAAGLAAPTERPPEELDAALIFAPVGALIPAALEAVAQGRRGGRRRHPHERHPELPLSHPVGRAGGALGRQPDPRRRRGVPRAGPDRCRSAARSDAIRWRKPTKPSTTSAPAACTAPQCWCPVDLSGRAIRGGEPRRCPRPRRDESAASARPPAMTCQRNVCISHAARPSRS